MKKTELSSKRQLKITEFSRKVLDLIGQIPVGRVATYGQIAKLAGKPHGARGVGWILNSSTKAYCLPWQRVLGAPGKISFPFGSSEFKKQKSILTSEGVEVSPTGQVDLKIYQWKKTVRTPKSELQSKSKLKPQRKSQPQMFSGKK